MSDPRDEMTERLLVAAGVGSGMRVLDVGCGSGSVTCMLAKLVGEGGQVLGIDRDAQPLALARERAHQLALPNIAFVQSDLSALPPDLGLFDAAVGRRVLMYVPNPVDVVRRISAVLHPGGVVIFQEHDATMVPGRVTPMPLHEQVHNWIWRTVEREGANTHMGFDLASVLGQAGLVVEHVRAEAVVQTPGTNYPVTSIVRAMLPRIVERGVASEEEVDVETLEQRLSAERLAANSTYVSDMVFGAWARKRAGA